MNTIFFVDVEADFDKQRYTIKYSEQIKDTVSSKKNIEIVKNTLKKSPKKSTNDESTDTDIPFELFESGRRNQILVCQGEKYIKNNKYGEKIYWKCSRWHIGCKARAITLDSKLNYIIRKNSHNHS